MPNVVGQTGRAEPRTISRPRASSPSSGGRRTQPAEGHRAAPEPGRAAPRSRRADTSCSFVSAGVGTDEDPPDVVDKSATDAESDARRASGFQVVATEDEASDTVAEGLVVDSNPAPGKLATVGSTVTVFVSTGPAPITVPDVSGDDQVDGDARADRDRLLQLRRRCRRPSSNDPDGPGDPHRPAGGHRPREEHDRHDLRLDRPEHRERAAGRRARRKPTATRDLEALGFVVRRSSSFRRRGTPAR